VILETNFEGKSELGASIRESGGVPLEILNPADSHKSINPEPIYSGRSKEGFGRRRVLRGVTGAATLIAAPAILNRLGAEAASSAGGLFSLGVASGDPDAHSVMLWTRLAPDPLSGGGMGNRPVSVRWQIATDPAMIHVLREGGALAHPVDGHVVSTRVTATALQHLGAGELRMRDNLHGHPEFSHGCGLGERGSLQLAHLARQQS
jgi:PhoD-like phosphatase, N-terminal domain